MLQGLMNRLDLPGSTVRDLATWLPGGTPAQNPLDQWMSPDDESLKTSGRQLLRDHGLAGQDDTWENWLTSAALEAGMDPFTYLSLGLGGAMKGLGQGALKAGTKAAKAVTPTGMQGIARQVGGNISKAAKTVKDGVTSAVKDSAPAWLTGAEQVPGMIPYSIKESLLGQARGLPGQIAQFAKNPTNQRYGAGFTAAFNSMTTPDAEGDMDGDDGQPGPMENPYSADINQPSYDDLVREHDMFSRKKKVVDAMRAFMTHAQKQQSQPADSQMQNQLFGSLNQM